MTFKKTIRKKFACIEIYFPLIYYLPRTTYSQITWLVHPVSITSQLQCNFAGVRVTECKIVERDSGLARVIAWLINS